MSVALGLKSTQIAADIQRVASELSIEPVDVSRRLYLQHGIHSERQLSNHGGLPFIKRTFFGKDARQEGEIRAGQLVNTEVNRLRRLVGDQEYLAERLQLLVGKMPPVKIDYRPRAVRERISRTLNLLISDLHLGSFLTKKEHLKDFGPEQEAIVLWAFIKNVCEYKLEHRGQTEIVVNVLGDIMENELHGPAGAELLHLQVCRSIYLLSQAIGLLASSFAVVRVNFTPGNHGRDVSVHPKRATHQKYNGLETSIYYAVKTACRNLKHVSFNQPLTPWVEYLSQGHKVYATHGDTHLNPGNPGSKIDVKGLENQTNRINASLRDKDEYKIFAVGHVHQAMVTQLVNGAYLITNGAGVPPGGFAQSLNIMEAPQTQVMWESVPDYPVGDFRFITASPKGKLGLIKPFLTLEDF